MSADEAKAKKREERIKKYRDEIEKKTGKSPEALYEEREKRLRDVIELKVPDRVPVVLLTSNFPAAQLKGKVTVADSYFDHEKWVDATIDTLMAYDADIFAPGAGGPGEAHKILAPHYLKFAGYGLGENSLHQHIEPEPLDPKEYEHFLSDPGDWVFRCYLPRIWKTLEPLGQLPSLHSMMGAMTMSMVSSSFLQPGIEEAFAAIFKAGKESAAHMKKASALAGDMEQLGMVNLSQGMVAAPFDVVSDYLRGMAGTMMDMYRYPDQLVRTCELIYNWQLENGKRTTGNAKLGNPKRVGTALHRGSDGFMSLKQFEKFYWPTFKQLVLDMIELGYVHIPFYEGNWEQRLEYMLDFPKAKTIARFALTDLKKAKEVLGGHTAIMGGVPHTMLQASTPDQIDAYCKDLIETVGKDGGFILSSSTGITNEAKPENVAAMVNAAHKYGKY